MSHQPRRAMPDGDGPSPDTDQSVTETLDESLFDTNAHGIRVDAMAYRELGETQPMSRSETFRALGAEPQSEDVPQRTQLRPAVTTRDTPATEFDPDRDDYQLDTLDESQPRRGIGRVILISVLAVIVAVGLFMVGRNIFGPADQGIKADRMVVEYLEAVSRGDAEGALKFSPNPPADGRLLTSAVLRESINRAPLTDIKVTASNDSQVQVEYNLGGDPVTGVFDVMKQDGRWAMPQAWGTLEVTENDLNMPFLLNSVPFDGPGVYPIFPGSYLVTPRTDTVSMDHRFMVPDNASDQTMETVQLELTDVGRRDAVVQIRNDLQRCIGSNQMKPVNCPYAIPDATKSGQKIIPESVRTQLVNDPLDGVNIQTQPGTPVATADLKIEFTLQGKVIDNGDTLDLGTQTEVVNATAIVSYDQEPPSVGWTVIR